MKKLNLIYWISTILFSLMMLMAGVQNTISTPDSVKLISTDLGYPLYFVAFVGIVKILGVIGILVPGFPRVTEWAYAGLFFDLISAIYSMLAIGTEPLMTVPMLIFIIPGIVSYIYYHKRLKAPAQQ